MSAIGPAVTALTAACSNAGVTGVTVVDGQVYGTKGDYLAVGWAGEDNPGVVFERQDMDAGAVTVVEQFTVSCLLYRHTGQRSGSDSAGFRDALLSTFGQFAAAVRNDAALLNLLMRPVQVTTGELTQMRSESGFDGWLAFTVACQAMSSTVQ